jgi:hypothetical protein
MSTSPVPDILVLGPPVCVCVCVCVCAHARAVISATLFLFPAVLCLLTYVRSVLKSALYLNNLCPQDIQVNPNSDWSEFLANSDFLTIPIITWYFPYPSHLPTYLPYQFRFGTPYKFRLQIYLCILL